VPIHRQKRERYLENRLTEPVNGGIKARVAFVYMVSVDLVLWHIGKNAYR
jgi:hypothetical protein